MNSMEYCNRRENIVSLFENGNITLGETYRRIRILDKEWGTSHALKEFIGKSKHEQFIENIREV